MFNSDIRLSTSAACCSSLNFFAASSRSYCSRDSCSSVSNCSTRSSKRCFSLSKSPCSLSRSSEDPFCSLEISIECSSLTFLKDDSRSKCFSWSSSHSFCSLFNSCSRFSRSLITVISCCSLFCASLLFSSNLDFKLSISSQCLLSEALFASCNS